MKKQKDYSGVKKLIDNITNETRKNDSIVLIELLTKVTGHKAALWDGGIIGFGSYHYVNKTNEGDMPILAFAPRKTNVTLYLTVEGLDPYEDYLKKIGKYKRGKVCLYINKLADINLSVLEELLKKSYNDVIENL